MYRYNYELFLLITGSLLGKLIGKIVDRLMDWGLDSLIQWLKPKPRDIILKPETIHVNTTVHEFVFDGAAAYCDVPPHVLQPPTIQY